MEWRMERTGIEPVTPCLQSHSERFAPRTLCRFAQPEVQRPAAFPAWRSAAVDLSPDATTPLISQNWPLNAH
jgi:hypothetical protein